MHKRRRPIELLRRTGQRMALGGHLLVDALRRCVRAGREFGHEP
ncbi:MAG: hypothetical protein ACLP4R_13270 [Solirubrobacteraceae bacterium]